ncbi:MAG TPA: Flp pilus assembly protein CpaB [Phycisphaerae bacterium]|nr:Flp pilus assembly protein CpaB [Phycisphaerales bacterium]HRX86079.1 Flp pilus assembly protein CpaB [Phycisphaerae bacterium]
MKSKALIPLAVGVVVGIVAIKYTMDAMSKAKGAPTSVVKVVMAQKDIPATVLITPDMLAVAETPKTPLLPQETYTEAAQLEGRVALKSIPRGSPVLPSMVAPKGTKPGLTTRVPEGYRAVAVKIDESSGVGYLVHPEDWVDVLAVMEVKRLGKVKTESKLILERVQVAAVGQDLNEEHEEGANRNVQTVTLLVKVEDVPKLHMAQTRGRITLAMRGSDDMTMTMQDDEKEELEAMATTTTPKAEAPPAPDPTMAIPYTVTVINDSAAGNGRSATQQVTYPDEDSIHPIDSGRGDMQRRSAPYRRPGGFQMPDVPRATGENEEVNEPADSSEVSE